MSVHEQRGGGEGSGEGGGRKKKKFHIIGIFCVWGSGRPAVHQVCTGTYHFFLILFWYVRDSRRVGRNLAAAGSAHANATRSSRVRAEGSLAHRPAHLSSKKRLAGSSGLRSPPFQLLSHPATTKPGGLSRHSSPQPPRACDEEEGPGGAEGEGDDEKTTERGLAQKAHPAPTPSATL